jgi:5-formyltetrahydrofolate cyclo-ligase
MQSPPTRTNKLVRVGGLCNISHDFNRRHSIGSNLGYLVEMEVRSIINTKTSLRNQFLQHRQQLPADLWREYSDRICQHLHNSPQFTNARTILAYQSCRQEPDLTYLFDRVNKQWGLPRCVGKDLIWHVWQPPELLRTGAYGILEPDSDSPVLTPDRVDLMLVPAVALDRQGYRLGYGGGYYDRLRAHPLWGNIPTIGITFDFAYVAALPIDPWDLKLDAVCTELGYTTCSD